MKKITMRTFMAILFVLPTILVFSQGKMHESPNENVCLIKGYQAPATKFVNSIFIEDFSSGTFPPAGWTIVGDGQDNWSESATNNAGGAAPEAMLGWSPQFVGNTKLVTSEIATSGYTSLLFEMKHNVNDYGGGYTLKVETTSDGTTWNEAWSVDVSGSIGPETLQFLIDNDDVGSDNFQLAFTLDGDSYQINYWYIDDVMLSETVDYDAAVVSIDMPWLLATGTNLEPGATVKNLGSETASFDVTFEILDGGSSIYSEVVTVTDLGAFESEALTYPTWIAITGSFVVEVTADLTGDANPDNDMMSLNIEVVDGLVAKKPLYEEFTSSTCGPCVAANIAIGAVLDANPDEYTLIKYQMSWPGSGDPYYTEEGGVRKDYYGCTWVPDLYINSDQLDPAGSLTQAIFDAYANSLTALEIGITEASIDDEHVITVAADLTPLADYAAGLTAHIVVVEKLTVGNVGTNGETEWHNVMMKMLPDALGTTLEELNTGVQVSLSQTFDMDDTNMETPNDLAVVVFVQDNTDKSIVQSAVLDVDGAFDSYNVTFTVEDVDSNPIEGAEIEMEGNGLKTTDGSGQAVYEGVFAGNYTYDITATGFFPGSGSVTVIDQDVSETAVLEAPDFYWFEMFDTEIPADWTTHASGWDYLYWYDGEVIFFRQSSTNDPIMLVTPAIEIESAGMLYFDMGNQGNIPQDCAFGTVTDPTDPSTFTELALYTPTAEWQTFEYDISTLGDSESEVYFAWAMTASDGCFYSIDNVIITEGGGSTGTIVFEDDMEAYNAGEQVACQNPDDWTTWDNAPCSGTDAYVSSDQAFSGVNSVNVVTDNDLVMDLDEYLTSGKHTVSVMVYIPTGGDGYYNILSAFVPAPEWAFEVYFNAGGDGAVSAGATGAATFTYDFDTWIESKVVIDLNADWAQYYIDDELIIEWPWTAGASGGGNALQLGALDFFGATPSTTFYFDDLVIETAESLPPPTDLTSEVVGGNDVQLHWVGPGGVGYIQWDAGTNTGNGIGLTGGGSFLVASRWLPADLTPYDGLYMTSLTIFPNQDPAATYVLKVWTGPDAGTEIMSQDVASVTIDEFNEIALDNPVQIDASQELWFGYEVTHGAGTFPAGCDDGPAVQEFGDQISLDGVEWTGMSATYGLDYNWNIAAYLAESNDGKSLAQPMVKQPMKAATGNFVASGSNGSMTKMDKKSTKGFIGFNVYRNDAIIAEEILETTYLDMDLLPGTYTFDVKAVYDEGISDGAGPVEETILGGVDRDLVIVEIGTGTWCQYCPGAALGADDLVSNGKQVGVIEYHGGDNYETTESVARLDFYGLTGYPTAWFDGVISVVGGNATQSMYPTYLPKYETRIEIPSLFTITAEAYNTGGNNFEIVVDAEMIEDYPWLDDDIVLQVVLTESEIPENWGGLNEVNFVCRDMIPDENGTDMDFAASATQSVTLDFTIPSSYDMENLELIVFIQDNTTKEVLQGNFADYITGIENMNSENTVSVYPNPANETVNVASGMDIGNVKVFNNMGQLISDEQVDGKFYQLNTSQFETGIYFFQVENNEGVISKRIVIQ